MSISLRSIQASLLIFCLTMFAGCSTTHSSANLDANGASKIVIASEKEMMSASLTAIKATFPGALIHEMQGYQRGYSWFTMPLIDRTDFLYTIELNKGKNSEGQITSGYSYKIDSQGTQEFVGTRYVTPLIEELERTLSKRGLKFTTVMNATAIPHSDERKSVDTTSKGKYADLIQLDDLLKKGILTESEFQIQKKKILSE